MKNERPSLAKPSMFCFATMLMLVTTGVLAQELKTAKSDGAPTSGLQARTSPSSPEVAASAQTAGSTQAQGQDEMSPADAELVYAPVQVGDATQSLFAWQRSGEISSATSRPIAGTVANRSYERYLKSFEFPIPERMSSSVKSTSGGGGSSGR